MSTLYDFTMKTIDGADQPFAAHRDRVVLVVNVASACGLTPQYEGLQKLHEKYADRGLSVLGFPCNQFAGQEPGSEEEIKGFCRARYGVTFPMYAKIDVNGEARAPLYGWLTSQDTAPEGSGDVKWNFGKFLIGRKGQVVARFDPTVTPESPALVAAIERELA